MRPYLTNRQQRVIQRDKTGKQKSSEWATISRGVPQGSTLDPVLFLVYVNEVLNVLADYNTTLFTDGGSIEVRVPSKGLKLNVLKSKS